MFTGIIQKVGAVRAVETSPAGGRLLIGTTPWAQPYEPGESIAVNGVCLTLVEVTLAGDLRFDVLQETFRRTNLGGLRAGAPVSLERALRLGEALGGHYVCGHVDDVGRVQAITPVGRDRRVTIAAPLSVLELVVHKGSITCDGISLTVAERGPEGFSVHLIPHTLAHTHWNGLAVGDAVNLEADLFAKHVKHLAETGVLPRAFSWSAWRDA
jgi:riboflavin synthase